MGLIVIETDTTQIRILSTVFWLVDFKTKRINMFNASTMLFWFLVVIGFIKKNLVLQNSFTAINPQK